MITAPFNFVPLSDKVFFPPWAEDVSHDVPFKDGESGVIDITITAKSPIFIRNHSSDRDNPSTEFCNHNGQYYIPGSSVKGMVRNVLEIMSFSKLNKNSYDDNTYAVRDLSSAQNFYMKQMNLIDAPFTQCGWLKIVDGNYVIEDCGTPGRINHTQIDYALGIEFAKHFKLNDFDAKDTTQKTSEYKYNLVNNKIHTITVGEMYLSESNRKYDKREFYKYDKNGKNVAQLILTGQPTPRKNTGKMGDGKGFEFLFFDSKNELKIDQEVVENFKFAYFDKRDTEPKESPDWKYWKEKLYSGEKIPVFFQKNGSKILHFGLSYLYKLPYEHSIKDGLSKIHFDDRADLAESIFGYINKVEHKALKGRVQFSHFKATTKAQSLTERIEILGTPRASYYPIYIRQYNTDFKTYMDSNFSIAGRKRYPIHKGNKTVKTENTGNENVGTKFIPLKDGVVFKGKLRYHNLKKSELGAILSALTFHNTKDTFHNIGMAKSLGYGKIDIKLEGIKNIETYLREFEMHITEQILEWSSSNQLKELVSMAVEQNNGNNSKLQYLTLKDFANNKSNDKDYLRCYTELHNIKSICIKSLVYEDDLKELEIKNQEYLEKQKEYKKQRKKKKEHDDEYQVVKTTKNIAIIESFISKYPDSEYISEATKYIDTIIKHEEANKNRELQLEAESQWQKVQKVEAKHKQNALQDFIEKYPNSLHIEEAKKQLQTFQVSEVKQEKKLDFSDANDIKSLERAMKAIEHPTQNDELLLIDAIKSIYPTLNKKKKGQFTRSKLIPKWIGADKLNMLIKNL